MLLEWASRLTVGGLDGILTALDVILTALVAAIGLYLAHSIRRQLKLRAAERRLEAYRALWSEMALTSPTAATAWRKKAVSDLTAWQDPRNPPFPRARRERFAEKMTEWYYEEGNGMFLDGVTREMFFMAKKNLTCDVSAYCPTELGYGLGTLFEEHQELVRGYLSAKQLSVLRTQMKSDLTVYASARSSDKLEPHEKAFVAGVGGNPYAKPWRGHDLVPVGVLGRCLYYAASRRGNGRSPPKPEPGSKDSKVADPHRFLATWAEPKPDLVSCLANRIGCNPRHRCEDK